MSCQSSFSTFPVLVQLGSSGYESLMTLAFDKTSVPLGSRSMLTPPKCIWRLYSFLSNVVLGKLIFIALLRYASRWGLNSRKSFPAHSETSFTLRMSLWADDSPPCAAVFPGDWARAHVAAYPGWDVMRESISLSKFHTDSEKAPASSVSTMMTSWGSSILVSCPGKKEP